MRSAVVYAISILTLVPPAFGKSYIPLILPKETIPYEELEAISCALKTKEGIAAMTLLSHKEASAASIVVPGTNALDVQLYDFNGDLRVDGIQIRSASKMQLIYRGPELLEYILSRSDEDLAKSDLSREAFANVPRPADSQYGMIKPNKFKSSDAKEVMEFFSIADRLLKEKCAHFTNSTTARMQELSTKLLYSGGID